MAVALLVPITFFMDPVPAISAIVTAVAMAIFAGDVPGALLRIPGTPASAAYADEGPTLKRIRPRAQGRAYRIRKRTSHITVEVESVPAKTGRGGRGGAKGRAR